MEEAFKNPVQLSKGINLRELVSSVQEFHIDVDFRKSTLPHLNIDDDLFPDAGNDSSSDDEDILKEMEDSIDKLLLSSPEYHSFSDLSPKMTDCLSSGDVKMMIIEEGTGPLVPVDAEVIIHYAAYWEKASIPFDSSLTMNNGAPVRVQLGQGRLLPGLEIGLTFVRGPSARFHLLLTPRVTWGEHGAAPRIKPETSLFVVNMYKFEDTNAGVRFNDLPTSEQCKFEVTIKTITSIHTQAKHLFNKKRYKKAISNYQQCLNVLNVSRPSCNEQEMEVKKLRVTSILNLAVCYYKINKPKYVINMCESLDRIIDIESHCKALFYYGRAHQMLGKTDKAIECYKKALKLQPKNKEIGNTLAELDKRVIQSVKEEKEMWQNAFTTTCDKKEKITFDVDEDFQIDVRAMCQDLAGRNEYAKLDLSTGFTRSEVDCIKHIVGDFKNLVVLDDGEGKNRKISIVRKI